jgi:ribosomal protein S18 acetylase RimI-like enzyme
MAEYRITFTGSTSTPGKGHAHLPMTKQITKAVIRRAQPRDAAAIAQVQVDSWQAAYLGLIPVPVLNGLSVPIRAANWRRILGGDTTPGSRTWVLLCDGSVLGFVSAGPTRDDDDHPRVVGEVYAIYLSPAAWGRGLGSELLETAHDDLAARRFTTATLWVLAGNLRARRFYELHGYVCDGARRPVPLGRTDLPEVRYRRQL